MTARRDVPAARSGMRLLADVGGTNTRCALAMPGEAPDRTVSMRNDDHADLASALEAFLATIPAHDHPVEAAIAVAAPISGDEVQLTNRAWQFSRETLRRRLRLDRLELVNDFTAVAFSLPALQPADLLAVGGGTALPGYALAVLGPGTGLGVSGLVPLGRRWAPVSGEGGHVTLAAANEFEARVISHQRERIGHVSAERFLSGPGLLALYVALASELALSADAVTPEEVGQRAARGDELAGRTLQLFFAMLGTVAADLALTLGARGGVYLAGGILPALREKFLASGFRERFEDKGRYRSYLAQIPTWLVVNPNPAIIGLQCVLDHDRT